MKSWIEFWDGENDVSDNIWKKGNLLFFKNTLQFLDYKPSDIVLDFGSGKGFFSELIIDRAKEVHLAETSKSCLDICKDKFSDYNKVYYHKISSDNYLNFNFLDKKFNKIFVISVIQYFNSTTEFKILIEQCKKVAMPHDCQMIIADIPINKNIFMEIFHIIYSSILLRTFIDTTILFIKSYFGDYRKTRQRFKMKTYDLIDLKSVLDKLKLEYKIINGINGIQNRISILINF